MTDRISAEHWELRATEALTIAKHLKDPECRRLMMEIGARYQRMAESCQRLTQAGREIDESSGTQ